MQTRWGGKLCAAVAAAIAIGAPVRAAEVRGDDPLARSVHQAIAGALATALDHARSYKPVIWGDPASDLSGSIIVFPPVRRGNGWCRSFRYDVHDGRDALTESGVQCRDPAGRWAMAGAPHQLDRRASSQEVTPNPASPSAKAQSERMQLQRNLARLAYTGPSPDGASANPDAALTEFEADEGMRQGTDEDAVERALARSLATLARSGHAGSCPLLDGEQDEALACGHRR